MEEKHCGYCKTLFEIRPNQQARKYCSDLCRTASANARRRKQPDHWSHQKRICHFCKQEFQMTPDKGRNTQHCSLECSRRSRRWSTARFYKQNPDKMAGYNRRRYEKHGRDSLIARLYKKYPDLPRTCEAKGCKEGRVLEAAHKPAHKRNGAWRTMSQYERYMFWMLCPTHHKLIDLNICAPLELGLTL